MRARLLSTLVFAGLAALLVSAATAPQPGFALPSRADVQAKEPRELLGTVWNEARRVTELVHVDPTTLRPFPAPKLRVGHHGLPWSYSRTGDTLAIVTHVEGRRGIAASLQILDPATFRRSLALPLGNFNVLALAWLEPDRVVALALAYHPERLEVLVVAPSAKRVIARTPLDGDVQGIQRTPDGLVALLSPKGRIGVATLAVAGAGGEVRSVALERVWIGFERSEGDSGEFVGKQRGAGFTVDPDGGRAFVFPAGSDAAAIDLASLAVTYHTPHEPVSLFGRLGRFLDPAATAKAIDGPSRSARWLGGGLVAVTGVDYATWKDRESRVQSSSTPAGLMLVDTNTWHARTFDRGAAAAAFGDGVLLATGGSYNSETRDSTSMGLAAYGLDGARRFRMFEQRQVWVTQVYRGLAYVIEDEQPLRVVEIASGRVVSTRRDAPPWLLLDGASFFGG